MINKFYVIQPKICSKWVYLIPLIATLQSITMAVFAEVNVPRTDEWTLIATIIPNIGSTGAIWGGLWEQYAETRIPIIRLLSFLDLKIDGKFSTLEMGILSQSINLLILLEFTRNILIFYNYNISYKQIFVILFFCFIVTTPINQDNNTWWLLISYKLVVLGSLICFGCVSRNPLFIISKYFWFGFILSYLSHGYWVVIVPTIISFMVYKILANKDALIGKYYLINFMVFGAISALLGYFYFFGLDINSTTVGTDPLKFTTDPLLTMRVFLTTLGNPFNIPIFPFQNETLIWKGALSAIAIGYLAIAIIKSFTQRYDFVKNDFFLLCVIFSLGVAAVLSIGRIQHDGGYYSAIAIHYVIVLAPFWAGILGITLLGNVTVGKFSHNIVVCTFVILSGLSLVYGHRSFNHYVNMMHDERAKLLLALTMNDDEAINFMRGNALHPNSAEMMRIARTLEAHGYWP